MGGEGDGSAHEWMTAEGSDKLVGTSSSRGKAEADSPATGDVSLAGGPPRCPTISKAWIV